MTALVTRQLSIALDRRPFKGRIARKTHLGYCHIAAAG
jgi:hypothetical protein